MKAQLTLTLDEDLIDGMKELAAKNGTSVSALVEEYFKKLTRPVKRKNVVDIIKELNKPAISAGANLKELYYEEQKQKSGF